MNAIHWLFDGNDQWVMNKMNLHNVVRAYFTNMFAASNNPNDIVQVTDVIRGRLSNEDNDLLIRLFDLGEFHMAIKQMHKDKATGPDGLEYGGTGHNGNMHVLARK